MRKLSPTSLNDARIAVIKEWAKDDDAAHKEPRPPLAKGVGGELEPNPHDPDYSAAQQAWAKQVALAAQDRWLVYAALDAVVCEIDQDAVVRKERALQLTGQPIWAPAEATPGEIAQVLYVTKICITTTDDLREFIAAVTQRSLPSEEGIAAHVATFQGNVEGA